MRARTTTSGGHYNDQMRAVRYVYILALVVWLGGMVVLGAVVAPATFQVLQASEPVTGRELGGAVFTTNELPDTLAASENVTLPPAVP